MRKSEDQVVAGTRTTFASGINPIYTITRTIQRLNTLHLLKQSHYARAPSQLLEIHSDSAETRESTPNSISTCNPPDTPNSSLPITPLESTSPLSPLIHASTPNSDNKLLRACHIEVCGHDKRILGITKRKLITIIEITFIVYASLLSNVILSILQRESVLGF